MQDAFYLLNYKRSTKQYPRRISAIKRRFFMKEFNINNEHKYCRYLKPFIQFCTSCFINIMSCFEVFASGQIQLF